MFNSLPLHVGTCHKNSVDCFVMFINFKRLPVPCFLFKSIRPFLWYSDTDMLLKCVVMPSLVYKFFNFFCCFQRLFKNSYKSFFEKATQVVLYLMHGMIFLDQGGSYWCQLVNCNMVLAVKFDLFDGDASVYMWEGHLTPEEVFFSC